MFRRRTEPDAGWLREMLETYERPLLRYAIGLVKDPETAKDVVQETFLKLCDADVREIADRPAPWLFTVCRNRAIDHLRKEKRMKVPRDEHALDRVPDTTPPTATVLELRQSQSQLLLALGSLPENQQELVRLKFQNGLSYKEISRVTGHSVSNVGFLLHVALKSLREAVAETETRNAGNGGRQ
jgi:RNA polymerase sigma-70 factor (ECF subfamily)